MRAIAFLTFKVTAMMALAVLFAFGSRLVIGQAVQVSDQGGFDRIWANTDAMGHCSLMGAGALLCVGAAFLAFELFHLGGKP